MATSLPNGVSQNHDAPQTNGITKSVVNGYARSYSAKHKVPAHFIGGNHLKAALNGPVKEFVVTNDGHTVITSVSDRGRKVVAEPLLI